MVEQVFDIGEHRKGDALGIVFGNDGASVLDAVVAADSPVLLLLGVEEIDHVEWGICLVAIVQKESGKAAIEQIDGLLVSVGNVIAGKAVLLSSLLPVFINPDPGPVIEVNEVLIIEMYRWN